MLDPGNLFLSRVGIDNTIMPTGITDTAFHHVVVTKSGTNVVFYVDGTAYARPPYSTTYTFSSPAAVGARGDTLRSTFLGRIDECSIYNRALTASEVQSVYNAASAGKCDGVAPTITSQPQNTTVLAGTTAALNVSAAGSQPLAYQWQRNGTALNNETNSLIALSDVHTNAAGLYSVVVRSDYGRSKFSSDCERG